MTHSSLGLQAAATPRSSTSSRPASSYLFALAILSGLLGIGQTGWGSFDHKDLDDSVVMKWGIMHDSKVNGSKTNTQDNKDFVKKGGIIEGNEYFSTHIRQIDGVNKVRALLYTSEDFTLKSLNSADSVPVKDLYKYLGLTAPDFKKCMSALDIDLSMEAFPSNLLIKYDQIRNGECKYGEQEKISDVMNSFVDFQTRHRKALRSFGGNKVAAIWSVEFFCKSWLLSNDKPALFHLNIMGDLPDYSKDFLEALGMSEPDTVRIIRPVKSKWFPSFKENISADAIEYFIGNEDLDI